MSRSNRLRLTDVRRVFRVLGDCRELGHDRAAWMSRAVEGLRESVDAMTAIGVILTHPMVEAIQPGRTFWDLGWPTERDRSAWIGLLKAGRFSQYPTVQRILQNPGRLRVRSRANLVSDRVWRRSAEFNEDRAPLDQDDTLIGIDWPTAGPAARVFSLNRALNDPPFNDRERRLVRLFLREAHLLSGTVLNHDEAGPIAALSPRLRAVADALAEGDAEKQVALRLGVSRHTVHDYVKDLYRRCGVTSRGELLAYYHRYLKASRCGGGP